MYLREAYELAGEPEPKDEDAVNIFCLDCDGQWYDTSSGIHVMGGPEVTYTNYLGAEHCELLWDEKTERASSRFICPNGCTGGYDGQPKELERFDSHHRNTPYDDWKQANLLVEMDKLEDRIKDIEHELKCYGG